MSLLLRPSSFACHTRPAVEPTSLLSRSSAAHRNALGANDLKLRRHGLFRCPVRAVAETQQPSQLQDDSVTVTSDPFAVLEQAGSSQEVQDTATFDSIGVAPLLQGGLRVLGITEPSPIQASAIPHVLEGKNCAIQSYTGSGKTLAYLLPLLTMGLRRAQDLIKQGRNDVPIQALVVAPSQELAMQIVRTAKSLLPKEARSAVQQVIGGANPRRQADALAMNRPLLVVGTPGRLAEMMRMGTLKLHECPIMVLDEADQLMAPVFAEDMAHLAAHCGKRVGPRPTPPSADSTQATNTNTSSTSSTSTSSSGLAGRQTVLVSATLTPTLLAKAASYCADPVFVTAAAASVPMATPDQASTSAASAAKGPAWGWGDRGWEGPASSVAPKTQGSAGGVEELIPTMPPQLQHFVVVVDPHHKVDALRRAMWALGCERALVFMNFQQRLKDTQYKLRARNMAAGALHGEMDKLQRQNLLNDFRRGRMRALIVSDVAARGLDISACDVVFNLELPSSPAHYAHRAGRTGRMGAPGKVVSIVARNERFVVDKLQQRLGVMIVEAHVSHGEFRLGPAPADYKFEDDKDSDVVARKSSSAGASTSKAADRAAAAADGNKAEPKAGKQGKQDGAAAPSSSTADAVQRRQQQGDADEEGWPTLRRSDDAAGPQQAGASTSGRDSGTDMKRATRATSPPPSSPAAVSNKRTASQKRMADDEESDSDSDDDDDDDSDAIDDSVLDKFRGLTHSQVRSLRRADVPPVRKTGSTVMAELRAELSELGAERAATGQGQQQQGKKRSKRS